MGERLRIMRLHGNERDALKRYSSNGSWFYQVLEPGFKYNMTDIAAAIGLVQLGKCDELCAARQAIVERYNAAFIAVSCLEAPHDYADRKSARHLYSLRLRLEQLSINRDQFISELKKR